MNKLLTYLLMCMVLLGVTQGAISDGLRALYQFENGNAVDTMGLTNLSVATGTPVYPNNATCKLGSNCLQLDGSQYLYHSNPDLFTGDSSYTTSVWALMNNLNSGGCTQYRLTTIGRVYTGSNGGLIDSQAIMVNDDSSVATGCYGSNCAQSVVVNLTLNSWHFIVVTYNSTSSEQKLYFDNQLIDTLSIGDYGWQNDYFGIGTIYWQELAVCRYKGYMDNVAVWNRPLDNTEINSLWASGTGLDYPYVEATAPTLTNGSVKPSAVEVGAEVLFNVTGKQAENSDTTLYVCSNNVTSTLTCNRLCVSSAVAFNSATDTAITCTYTTNDTGYSNTAYAFLNSVGGSSPNLPLTYNVNHPPYTASAITYLDTTGDNIFYYRESMDYFRLSVNDSDNPSITVNFTVTDPDAEVKVNNVQGTQNGIVWGYETDLVLDALGTWTVSVVSTDVLGTSITNTTTFYVNSTQKSTSNNYYGVYYPNLPATTSIDNDLLYGYGVYEFNITI